MTCETPCKNCDRKGLPILFTRYAAAYSAQDKGMAALKPLQPTGHFQRQPGGVALQTALYNVRMLRPGYLYVHIDRGGAGGEDEWKGYAVHPRGYLTEFDVLQPGSAEVHVACARDARQANNSMVWVKDAKRVKKLWYMFHPDPIDPEHLFKEIVPNLGKYMQSFDVAGWANGSTFQKDTCQPGQLNSQIVEFSALTSEAVQTVGNEQHYGLMGSNGAERGWGKYTEARNGKHFEKTRHEMRDKDGSMQVTDTGAVGGMAIGPYVAEVIAPPYKDMHGPRLEQIAELLQNEKGVVVACEDAIGIAQELSLHHLTAAMPYVAWLKQVDDKDTANKGVTNQWKHAASESIKTVEAAIYKKAMLLYDTETDRLRRVREVQEQRHGYPVGSVLVEQKDGSYAEVSVKELEAQRKEKLDEEIAARESDRHLVSDVEAKAAGDKTRANYDLTKLKTFDDAHLEQIRARNALMDKITEDLIVWLKSDAFIVKTLGRYDRSPKALDTGDGARFAGQLCAILETMDSSPRGRKWYAELNPFSDDSKNIVWRMATLNNKEITQELKQAMESLKQTLPPATGAAEAENAEENARQQQAWAAMAAALGKIPKTLRGSQSLIAEARKVIDPKTSPLKKFKSAQKIADTACKNIHTVWCTAVIQAAKETAASARELNFAKGQLLLLAHGLGDKAIEFVRQEQRELDAKLNAQGKQGAYSNKRNPKPDSRAWNRRHQYKGEKLQARVERALEKGTEQAARNMRLPSVFGGIEALSLIPTFGRAAARKDDPRAGSESAGAIASAMGYLKSWRADYYEKNVYEVIKADAALAARANLMTAQSNELRMLKIGAAHWVAAAAVVGVMWDAVDAGTASKEGNTMLKYAYYGRAVVGGTTIGSAIVGAYFYDAVKIVRWCTRINLIAGAMTLAASYAIDKLKEKEWVEWLQAQPFRKPESKKKPHRTEALMVGNLANAIADLG